MPDASTIAFYSAAGVTLLAIVAFALAVVWCDHRRKTAIARACEYVNEGS